VNGAKLVRDSASIWMATVASDGNGWENLAISSLLTMVSVDSAGLRGTPLSPTVLLNRADPQPKKSDGRVRAWKLPVGWVRQ